MAEFNSYLLGKASKSVGNVTLFYMRAKNIARAKIFKRKDTVTPEILTQRAKLGILSQEGRRMLPVIRKGFVGVGKGSTSNAFVQLNMDAVEVDGDYNATSLCAAEHGCRGGGRRLQCHHQLPAVARGFGHPDYAEGGSHLQRAGQPVFFHRRVAGGGGRLRADGRQGVCRALRVGAEAHALGGFGDTGRA